MTKIHEDIDAERSLLATLAADGALAPGGGFADAHQAVLALRPEILMAPAHRVICEAIRELYAEAADINTLSLKAVLDRKGKLGQVGGFQGLVELQAAQEVGKPSELVAHLWDLWRKRKVMQLGKEAERLVETGMPVQEVLSDLQNKLAKLQAGRDSAKIQSAAGMLDMLQAMEPFRETGQDCEGRLVRFGIERVDDEVEAAPGHIVLVGARPGVGKSAAMIQGAWKTAEAGVSSLLVSLEMDRNELHARMAAWHTGVSQRAFRSGTYGAPQVWALNGMAETLERIQLWAEPSGVEWSRVEACIRDAVRVHGVRVVWIDHVLLMAKPNLGAKATDAACWTAVSRGMKRLAQELRIVIVGLVQLNRDGDNGEPKLSDLKETGGWEEDANAVLMLWPKDSRAQDDPAPVRPVMLKAAKNRSGQAFWKVELAFEGATNRMRQVERTTDAIPEARGRRMAR